MEHTEMSNFLAIETDLSRLPFFESYSEKLETMTNNLNINRKDRKSLDTRTEMSQFLYNFFNRAEKLRDQHLHLAVIYLKKEQALQEMQRVIHGMTTIDNLYIDIYKRCTGQPLKDDNNNILDENQFDFDLSTYTGIFVHMRPNDTCTFRIPIRVKIHYITKLSNAVRVMLKRFNHFRKLVCDPDQHTLTKEKDKEGFDRIVS